MKTAIQIAHIQVGARCAAATTGKHARLCRRVAAAIEQVQREVIEAALVAFGVCGHVDCPDVECSRVRSLSPEGRAE